MFKFYEVGGKIRDEIMGIPSKDVDYVAVDDSETPGIVQSDKETLEIITAPEMFSKLIDYLKSENFSIFLETPDCFTVRAKFPDGHKYSGVADFVMARKELFYLSGTRTPVVVPGTLYDDLQRRDFTVNAIAKDPDGGYYDPFNGIEDIRNKILKTPLDCNITFGDDPLRILRAIRFHITKGFAFSNSIESAIRLFDYSGRMPVVSTERIREELYKCFETDTLKTLKILEHFSDLRDYIFSLGSLWLKPQM